METNKFLNLSFCFILFFMLFIVPQKMKAQEAFDTTVIKKITILYTNNTNGSLEPCGCPGNKAGGMAQRMTIINEERKKDPDLLLFDAGDFFPTKPNIYHPDPVIEIMNLMRYDAVTLGDQEFVNGFEYLQKKLLNMKFEVLNTNMTVDKNVLFTKPSVVIEKKGLKIGVLGIISPNTFTFLPKENLGPIKFVNFVDSCKYILQTFHKEVNIVIALSHMGKSGDADFASTLYWMDIIIGAHDGALMDKPYIVNNMPIFQAGINGDHVGKIVIEYDTSARKIRSMKTESIFVDKKIAKDPEADAIIKNYDKNTPLFTDTEGNRKMLGANYCRKCHLEIFEKWIRSRHSQALATIKNERKIMHSNTCYICHVTNMNSNNLYGVECESCHTISKGHDTTRVKLVITEEVCKNCHTKDRSPNFDFIQYKEKIKH
ncbi:hypothetical protein HY745_07865 [Candidatus Desantisbacteria bacterium]|nr:hypothetical protein [Candidatus Desantisbacteria bacterium]